MNKRQLLTARNNSMRLLDPMQCRPRNCVRLNASNTKEHEIAKCKLCWQLLQEEKEFVTEAVFLNGKRADIFVLDTGDVIEVLHSETMVMAKKKIADYPVQNVIFIESKEVI